MLHISPVPAYSDNYIWMLQKETHTKVVVVDPGQAAPVLKRLRGEALELAAILITHQHYDHTTGVAELLEHYPDAEVIGPRRAPSDVPLGIDRPVLELMTRQVGEGDRVELAALDATFQVMEIPGHTLDHIAFVGEGAVFCGDTLFAAGCGRLFSGTAQMMTGSIQRLSSLPADTRMYCAHEYTVDNLGFAKWVEPERSEIQQRDQAEMQKQEQGQPTVPTTVALECATNPFVRLKEPAVIAAAEKYAGRALKQDWEVFAALREWKDREYD